MEAPPLFIMFARYFWAIGIAVMLLNGAIYHVRLRLRIADTTLQQRGKRVIRGIVGWGCVPWLTMGIGSTVGGIGSVFRFLQAIPFNPWVWLFYLSVIAVWAVMLEWVFRRDGAETVSSLAPLFVASKRSVAPVAVKAFCGIVVAGGCAALTMFFIIDIPIDSAPVP